MIFIDLPTCAASTSALSTLMMGLEIWTGDIFALNSGRRTWHPPGYQATSSSYQQQTRHKYLPPLQRSLSLHHLGEIHHEFSVKTSCDLTLQGASGYLIWHAQSKQDFYTFIPKLSQSRKHARHLLRPFLLSEAKAQLPIQFPFQFQPNFPG